MDEHWSILELFVCELEEIVSVELVRGTGFDGDIEIAHPQLLHLCLLARALIFGVWAQVDDDLDARILELGEMLLPGLAPRPDLVRQLQEVGDKLFQYTGRIQLPGRARR